MYIFRKLILAFTLKKKYQYATYGFHTISSFFTMDKWRNFQSEIYFENAKIPCQELFIHLSRAIS